MKVLVLGGTGAMGVHLVQLLSNNSIETFVTSRNYKQSNEKINYIQGNAHEIDFLQKILTGPWDAIVDFMVYTTVAFQERVRLLLDATTQYIFLSSARVYADSEQPITEISPRLLDDSKDKKFLDTDEYSLTKARQEDILINSGYNNWTIIRPYITYSENRLQLGVLEKEDWLYRALHGRTIVFSEDINFRKTTLTYGQDVAKGILAVIGNSSTMGEEFHITADNAIRWEEVLNIYLDVLEKHIGKRPKVVLKDLEHFIQSHPANYQIKYDRLYNREFDNSKINAYIETKHFVNTRHGLKNSLEKFLEKPDFKNINWRTEALKDKVSKEITPIFEIKSIKGILRYLVYRFIKK